MFGETYSLSLVTEFLDSKKISYKYCNANIGILFHNHGCRVILNDTYSISIQTHPDVAGCSFAETALQNMKTKQLVNGDVDRFNTPQELFDYITDMVSKYGCEYYDSDTDQDSVGKSSSSVESSAPEQ